MVTTAMRPSRDFRASNASRTEVARRSNRSRGVAVVTAPLEHHFTLNIEQAIERLSESSIRTWDVNIVEFFVQRIKSSNGTNSYKMNNTHRSYDYIVALLWSTSDMTYQVYLPVDKKSRYISSSSRSAPIIEHSRLHKPLHINYYNFKSWPQISIKFDKQPYRWMPNDVVYNYLFHLMCVRTLPCCHFTWNCTIFITALYLATLQSQGIMHVLHRSDELSSFKPRY